jgi:hypothetical protein
MGAEERLNTKSGYGYLKIVCSEMKIGWQLERISVRVQKEMAAGKLRTRDLKFADNDWFRNVIRQ